MKILDAGHHYELDCLDGDETQSLVFVKRSGPKFPFNEGSYPGTNCQEVLRALIDRCQYLQAQAPCAETKSIIANLRAALLLFELRAYQREMQPVVNICASLEMLTPFEVYIDGDKVTIKHLYSPGALKILAALDEYKDYVRNKYFGGAGE